MKNEKRLSDLEKAIKPKDEIVVYFVDDETGEHIRYDGGGQVLERLTAAEWDQYEKQPGRKIIVVDYVEGPIK